MSNPSTTTDNNGSPNYKNICDAYGCYSQATEAIELEVGKFGAMTFSVCKRCIDKFIKYKQDIDTRKEQPLQSEPNFVGKSDIVKRESAFKPQFTTADNLLSENRFSK